MYRRIQIMYVHAYLLNDCIKSNKYFFYSAQYWKENICIKENQENNLYINTQNI